MDLLTLAFIAWIFLVIGFYLIYEGIKSYNRKQEAKFDLIRMKNWGRRSDIK